MKVTYDGDSIDCNDVNIIYTRKVAAAGCDFLKMVTFIGEEATGNDGNKTTCSYSIPCNHGDVACTMEMMIRDPDVQFSLCEIQL